MPHPLRALLVIALAFGLTGGTCSQPGYNPVIANPTYPLGSGPRVAVDATHDNMHRIYGSYQGFRKLLEADGYVMEEFDVPFPAGCHAQLQTCPYWLALQDIDTFVIVNAREEISTQEGEVVKKWVREGGKLMLIADHAPFPENVFEIARVFNINWPNNYITNRTFSISGGTLAVHPVTLGFTTSEEILEVDTFTGSAFEPDTSDSSYEPILTFPVGATDDNGQAVGGFTMGMAVQFEDGRAYVSSEAAMFTAQSWGGMHTTPYNEQFLLNIMHWLDELL